MAEELIEMGQTALPAPAVPAGGRRMISLSREESEIVIRTVQSVAAFSREFPIEFHSYCPVDRWNPVLEIAREAVRDIQQQIASGSTQIVLDASSLMATMDIEECLTAARDRRLSSSKIALAVSAAGAIGETVFGIPWLGLPAYIISLAMILGRPLAEKVKETPAEPFRVGCRHSLGASIGDHTDKAKVIERVIVSMTRKEQRHHWGIVIPSPSEAESTVCLSKGKFRVRVEGWSGDQVFPTEGWEIVPLSNCVEAKHEISVWEPCGAPPRRTPFGPPLAESGHEETFWAEYVGPLTGGICRRAGPFG